MPTHLRDLDFPAGMLALRSLKDGWHDGEGTAYKPQDLDWFQEFCRVFPDIDNMEARVYPWVDGEEVGLEWQTFGGIRVSLDVDVVARTGDWHVCNQVTGKDILVGGLDLTDPYNTIHLAVWLMQAHAAGTRQVESLSA